MIGNTAEADDVAQEAVLRAWRARSSCRDAGARDAWLAQITRREVFRHAGRRSRRREDLGADAADAGSATDESLERVERRIDVADALDGLGALDRRLIVLRYEQDFTYRSAAELLGMPEGTVKVRLHRVHKRLAAALAEQRDRGNGTYTNQEIQRVEGLQGPVPPAADEAAGHPQRARGEPDRARHGAR